jgi:hypothetical protein
MVVLNTHHSLLIIVGYGFQEISKLKRFQPARSFKMLKPLRGGILIEKQSTENPSSVGATSLLQFRERCHPPGYVIKLS